MDGSSRWTCVVSLQVSDESSPLLHHACRLTLRASAANLSLDCINLGQGYVNFPPPVLARNVAGRSTAPGRGQPLHAGEGGLRLRKAIKELYGMQFGEELVPDMEIVVTSGANEGVLCVSCHHACGSVSHTHILQIVPVTLLPSCMVQTTPCFLCSTFPGAGQYTAFTTSIKPGDEVIIKPFFDQYLSSIAFHGGKCVYVLCHPSSEPALNVRIGKW